MTWSFRRWIRATWSSVLIVALALAMFVQFVVQDRHDQREADCRAVFTAALRTSLATRGQLASVSDVNQNTLILSVADLVASPPPRTVAEGKALEARYRKSFADFRARAAAIETERAKTPIPPLPDC